MKRKAKVREFDVIIEKSVDGWFIGSVPALPGCYTQGRTEKQLLERMREAIQCYLEAMKEIKNKKSEESAFVGIKKVGINAQT